jgi:hypothetical protein
LQELVLSGNQNLGDEGVMYLAQGLQGSSKIKLDSLLLISVGMGDAGLKSLAEAIESGALLECRKIDVNSNAPLCNIIPFSCALRCGGLKNLTFVAFNQNKIEPHEVTVLASALIEHCPRLNVLLLPKVGSGPQQAIKEIKDSYGIKRTLVISFN